MAIDQIKINSTAYDIGASASNISFNKNGTSLDATNVQSAIVEIDGDVGAKVDKVNGKGLSTNDFTDADKTKLNSIETGAQTNTITGVKGSIESAYRIGNVSIDKADIGLANVDNTADVNKPISTATQNALNNKVDKVTGKDLSTNDYTNADKTKLAGISAQANRTTVTQVQESGDTSKEIAQIGLDGETTSIYADDAKKVIESCYEEKTVTGNPITIKTISGSNAKALKLTMNPIQDLHGYDYPWVGGAGKNKLPLIIADIKTINTNGTWSENSYTLNGVTFTILTNSNNDIIGVKANGTASANTAFYINRKTTKDWLQSGVSYIVNGCPSGGGQYYIAVGDNITATYREEGNGVSFTPSSAFVENNYYVAIIISSGYGIVTGGLTFLPMIRLSTVTDATFAPYSNICPISGRTEASVTRTGTNQWDEEWEKGYIDSHGENTASANNIRSKNFIQIVPNTRYYLKSGYTTIVYCPVFFYDENKVFLSNNLQQIWNTVITTPSNAKYMRFYMNSAYGSVYNNDISINYPATDTEYHAYTAETHTKEFGQTVYGGKVVWNGDGSCKAVIDHITKKIKNMSFSEIGTSCFYTNLSDNNFIKESTDIICSAYKLNNSVYSYNGLSSGEFTTKTNGIGNLAYVTFKDDNYSTKEAFKTDMGEEEICFIISTPTEITLTAEQIELLKGNNVLSTNADDMELKYTELAIFDDYKAYVDNQIQINITDVLNASY